MQSLPRAIEQASRHAETLWQALFPTIMMCDDRAVVEIWAGGNRRQTQHLKIFLFPKYPLGEARGSTNRKPGGRSTPMPEEEAKPDDETRYSRLKGAPIENRHNPRESLVKH